MYRLDDFSQGKTWVSLQKNTPETNRGTWKGPANRFSGGGLNIYLFSQKTYLERQVSYFLRATLPLKPATIALKIGHLAFQVEIKVWAWAVFFLN